MNWVLLSFVHRYCNAVALENLICSQFFFSSIIVITLVVFHFDYFSILICAIFMWCSCFITLSYSQPVVGLHRWTHKMYDNLHMSAQRVAFKEHTQHFNIKKNTVNFLTFSEIKRWYRFAFIDCRISIHGEKWIAFL